MQRFIWCSISIIAIALVVNLDWLATSKTNNTTRVYAPLEAAKRDADYWGYIRARKESIDEGTVELVSAAYHLDGVYMSMQGPRSNQGFIKLSTQCEPSETLWITGIETNVVDAETLHRVSNEYFCHSNMTLNPDTSSPSKHRDSLGLSNADWRLFTLVPGRMSLALPDGFGVPIKNSTQLDYFTMALSQNPEQKARDVRMQTTVKFKRQSVDSRPLKSLYRRSLYVYQQHQATMIATEPTNQVNDLLSKMLLDFKHLGEHCGEICAGNLRGSSPSLFLQDLTGHPGATCCVTTASEDGLMPQFGKENTIHWMVPPGRHQYRTEVTEQMLLPKDTNAHYVTGHLHPYGESIVLRDVESREVIFSVKAECLDDRLGVARMDEYKSSEGIKLSRNRRYELIATYNNTCSQPIDAMAILYLYLLDENPTN